MSQEQQRSPPGTLLVSYLLAKADGSLSARQIRHRVAEAVGEEPAQSTVYGAIRDLRERGRLEISVVDGERRYRLE
jgi:DNA-binding PadR family transcriptional regulator